MIASDMGWPGAIAICAIDVSVLGFGAYAMYLRSRVPDQPATGVYMWKYRRIARGAADNDDKRSTPTPEPNHDKTEPMTYGMPGDLAVWLTSVTKLVEREPEWSWHDASARDAAAELRDLITSRLGAATRTT